MNDQSINLTAKKRKKTKTKKFQTTHSNFMTSAFEASAANGCGNLNQVLDLVTQTNHNNISTTSNKYVWQHEVNA